MSTLLGDGDGVSVITRNWSRTIASSPGDELTGDRYSACRDVLE
jgi:hypothetical protein